MEDHLGYVHALVGMSKLKSTYFWRVSNAANEINKLLHEKKLDIEKSEKAKLIQTLLNVLEKENMKPKQMIFPEWHGLPCTLDKKKKPNNILRKA